jgi:hypothetical protein
MTHSYQYIKGLPHTKKHLNAAFVHRLKKLCGRVFHLHVAEVFADEEQGDYVSVRYNRKDAKDCILSLCDAYGIGSDYIFTFEDLFHDGYEYMNIYLSQKKPTLR